MKRLILIFICVALLGSLCLPALGEALATRSVYVRCPDWETVYLWTDGDLGQVFGPAPGTKMIKSDDQYRLSIPDDLTEFTLSNGTVSTEMIIAAPEHDLYVTVDENETVTVEYGGYLEEPPSNTEAAIDYYLVGFINGADHGIESDSENLGDYRFVNGSLRATFTQDSYVLVKTSENAKWFMTDGWLGNDVTTARLFDASSLGSNAHKLFVPGNIELCFTLEENTDGSVTLSYTTSPSQTTPSIPTKPIPEMRTMRIKVPAFWTEVNVYTWEPEAFGPYPGAAVRRDGDVYQCKIPTTQMKLVISSQAKPGSIRYQTGNILLDEGKRDILITITGDNDYSIQYSGGTNTNAGKPCAPIPTSSQPTISVPTTLQPSAPIVTQPVTKPSTAPIVTQPITEPSTVPIVTQPVTVPSTDPIVTQPVTVPSTDPIVTQPVTEPTTEPLTTPVADPSETAPSGPSGATAPTAGEKNDIWFFEMGPDSYIANRPFGNMVLFLFGIVSAFVYLLFLMAKRNRFTGEVTPDGMVHRRQPHRLSKKAVVNAVKENIPEPSDNFDKAVFDAIEKMKQPPTE